MLGDEILNKSKERILVDKMKDFLDLLIVITKQNRDGSNCVYDSYKLVSKDIEPKAVNLSRKLLKQQSNYGEL